MTALDLQDFADCAADAARRAGDLLASYFRKLGAGQIGSKSAKFDLVSIADTESEKLIQHIVSEHAPDVGFIGEESANKERAKSDLVWVVDPLDGTSNYLSGMPIWCVSIALCESDLSPLVGVVHAPLLGQTWIASRGNGARVNNIRMHVRTDPPGGGLSNSMLATGFPYDLLRAGEHTNIANFAHMQQRFQKIRRLGSAAIDLAYVAEGIFDGMWELKLSPWDTAAGVLLVSEAGGFYSRIDGSHYTPGDEDMVVASTQELLQAMQHELVEVAEAEQAG